MANRWEDVEELLLGAASDDLEDTGTVRPMFVAFAGAALRMVAWLRPFEKGEYHDAFIELFALASPLGSNRFAVSVSGRAWSLEDPIPPVCADGDLRQRIVALHLVDGAGAEVCNRSVIRPFELCEGRVTWGEPQEMGRAEGWISEALEVLATAEFGHGASDAEIARQAQRVVVLGHSLYLEPALHARLAPELQH